MNSDRLKRLLDSGVEVVEYDDFENDAKEVMIMGEVLGHSDDICFIITRLHGKQQRVYVEAYGFTPTEKYKDRFPTTSDDCSITFRPLDNCWVTRDAEGWIFEEVK